MAPKQCNVCTQAESKYKCPSCLLPYCSVTCFKNHKEASCVKPTSSEKGEPDKVTAELDPGTEKPLSFGSESDFLQRTQLESIASSNEIRQALEDENLQEVIKAINRSCEPEEELDKAMEDGAFRNFTDKILTSMKSE